MFLQFSGMTVTAIVMSLVTEKSANLWLSPRPPSDPKNMKVLIVPETLARVPKSLMILPKSSMMGWLTTKIIWMVKTMMTMTNLGLKARIEAKTSIWWLKLNLINWNPRVERKFSTPQFHLHLHPSTHPPMELSFIQVRKNSRFRFGQNVFFFFVTSISRFFFSLQFYKFFATSILRFFCNFKFTIFSTKSNSNYRKFEFWTNATLHTFCFIEGIDDQESDKKTKGHFYPVTKEPTTPSQDVPRKRKTRHSQNPIQEMHVGWILDSRSRGGESGGGRTRNSDSVCSETGSVASSYGTPQSLPTFHHPSHALLKENQFTQLQYSKYHSRCLKGTV